MTNSHVISKLLGIIVVAHRPVILVTNPAEDVEVLQPPTLVFLRQMISHLFPQSYTLEITSLALDPGKVGEVVHVPREDDILVGIVAVMF